MASPKADVNPFVRRPLSQRLRDAFRALLSLPGLAYRTFRNWPKQLRYLLLGLASVALVFGLYSGVRFYLRKSEENAIRREWNTIENEFKTTNDTEKIIAGLGRILEIRPEETRARTLKSALETGVAHDPSDNQVMLLVMREHLRHQRLPELRREAQRRLSYEPRDYYAHFLMTLSYWPKDLKQAEPHLDALANPDQNPVNVFFDAVARSMMMLQALQRDTTKLRSHSSSFIASFIRQDAIANAEPGLLQMVLFLYGESFDLPALPSEMGLAWPSAQKVANLCYDGFKEKNDVQGVALLARLGPRLASALTKLAAANQINEMQRREYAAEYEDHVRKAWTFVLEKEPKNAEAYLGIITSYLRAGDGKQAGEYLRQALEAVGDNEQLLQLYAQHLHMHSRDDIGYERLKAAAERNPQTPRYWMLAAECAYHADRRDLAQAALEKAKAAMPDDTTIPIMQAVYATGTGYPEYVLSYLSLFPDADIATRPTVARIFVRALAEIRDGERLNHFLQQALDVAKQSNNPAPVIQSALGLLEALPQRYENMQRAAEYLGPWLERWRLAHKEIAQVHAVALARACDLKPGPIDPVAARTAILACERALTLDPNHVPTAMYLALMRIRGDRDPQAAIREIQPLLSKIDQLTPEQYEVLGMVYNGNRRWDDAIRVLSPAVNVRATAGCWVQLAIAYTGQGRVSEAADALDRASRFTMTDRERSDYLAARDLLTRVKP